MNATTATTTAPAALHGPGSLHWRYAGDRRSYLMGPYAGVLQLMHPGLGAGVEQHSAFFSEPWERFLRSVPQILGVTYDWPDAGRTARGIRDFHTGIKGVDAHGRRYHALDPEIYFWAHATMIMSLVKAVELFHHPLTDDERERLYAESCAGYRLYGVSDRPVPRDWAAFCAYYDRMCADVLEPTRTAVRLAHLGEDPPRSFPGLPDRVFRLVGPVASWAGWWLMRATLPPVVRERLGATWSRRDERAFRAFTLVVRRVFGLLPVRLRYDARARAAFRRTGIGPRGTAPARR